MKKLLKIVLVIILILIIWLFLSIYVSSLFSYKESDFNISEDFFQTKYYDKGFESEKNWYNEFVSIIKNINENSEEKLNYYDIQSKCFFELDENKKKSFCESIDKVENNISLEYVYKYIYVTQLKFKKLNEKEYIYDLDNFESLTWLFSFFRVSNYIAYKYIDEWQIEKGINILVNNQNIINNLSNNSDLYFINSLIILKIAQLNLNWVEYIIDNYFINDEIKEKIYEVMKKWEKFSMIENWLRREYISFMSEIDNHNKDEKKDSFINKIWYFLFYSEEEEKVLLKNDLFIVINNRGKTDWFYPKHNINNYIWRDIVINWKELNFLNQFQKEDEYNKNIQKVLEKLR